MFGVLSILLSGLVARSDLAVVLGGISVGAILIGALVGPLVKGSNRFDVFALVVYALLAGIVYVIVGAANGALFDTPGADLGARITRFLSQAAYGLLYLPFWSVFVAPFAFGWLVTVRVLRRRARLVTTPLSGSRRASPLGLSSPKRLALVCAAVILAYALFVALLPFILYDDPEPPWWWYRPVVLFGLLGVPAAVTIIGVVRGIRPLLIAAGVMCLMQAYIAFSGVTIGFVVPGLLLLVLGAGGSWPGAGQIRPSTRLASVATIVLTVGAWVSLLGLTEPRCYVTTRSADGTLVTTEVPATNLMTSGPIQVAGEGSGCSSGELSLRGITVSAVLAIGAIAFAVGVPAGGDQEPG
jgi:hypothetical protein